MKSNITVSRILSGRLPDARDRRLVVVTGARQTGKTTLLRQVYPGVRYVNLDAVENRVWLNSVPALSWGNEVGVAVLDEAQKEPSIIEKVKCAFDSGAVNFSALSGSAQILLLHKVPESLAGRAFVYELWPLTVQELASGLLGEPLRLPLFAELCSDKSPSAVLSKQPAMLAPEIQSVLSTVQNHVLTWGGMPELLRLSDEDRRQWLRSYDLTYLERDLGDLARLSDLMPFRKFQSIAALRSAGVLAYADLARDAGISADTARRYLEYLRLSYQAFLLPPYHSNLTSQVVKSPKIYWTDLGLLRQSAMQFGGLTGGVFETFVVSELHKLVQTHGVQIRLFYYRTRSGLEVDLLTETSGGLLGIEIKARESADRADAAGLRQLAEALGSRWRGGLVVHSGTTLERLCDPDIWAIPASRLLWDAK